MTIITTFNFRKAAFVAALLLPALILSLNSHAYAQRDGVGRPKGKCISDIKLVVHNETGYPSHGPTGGGWARYGWWDVDGQANYNGGPLPGHFAMAIYAKETARSSGERCLADIRMTRPKGSNTKPELPRELISAGFVESGFRGFWHTDGGGGSAVYPGDVISANIGQGTMALYVKYEDEPGSGATADPRSTNGVVRGLALHASEDPHQVKTMLPHFQYRAHWDVDDGGAFTGWGKEVRTGAFMTTLAISTEVLPCGAECPTRLKIEKPVISVGVPSGKWVASCTAGNCSRTFYQEVTKNNIDTSSWSRELGTEIGAEISNSLNIFGSEIGFTINSKFSSLVNDAITREQASSISRGEICEDNFDLVNYDIAGVYRYVIDTPITQSGIRRSGEFSHYTCLFACSNNGFAPTKRPGHPDNAAACRVQAKTGFRRE